MKQKLYYYNNYSQIYICQNLLFANLIIDIQNDVLFNYEYTDFSYYNKKLV